jgi:hypothetical protein
MYIAQVFYGFGQATTCFGYLSHVLYGGADRLLQKGWVQVGNLLWDELLKAVSEFRKLIAARGQLCPCGPGAE